MKLTEELFATEYQVIAFAAQLMPQNGCSDAGKKQAAYALSNRVLLQVSRITIYLNAVAKCTDTVLIDLRQVCNDVGMAN